MNPAPRQPNNDPTVQLPHPFQLLGRTTVHTVAAGIIMNAIAPVLRMRQLGELFVNYAGVDFFIPWSCAFAASLGDDRVTLVVLAVIMTVYSYPDHLLQYIIATILGALLGTGIRTLLTQGGINA